MASHTSSPSFSAALLVGRQLPAFATSLLIAEVFFEWKSFALECLGVVAVWFVLDWLTARLKDRWRGDDAR